MLVRNLTPFPFGRLRSSRRPPRPEMAIVVRGTFDVVPDAPCRITTGEPTVQGFILGEVLSESDDPALAAPLSPNDLVPMKVNAEVLVVGSCTAPRGQPVTELPVEVRVDTWSKGLTAVGRRPYSDGSSGAHASRPLTFTTMPVDYRYAYGGPGYELNPAGTGITSPEAANLEQPGERLTTRGQRPARGPVALGALNARWAARMARLGARYGGAWRKERAPHPAEDFDWRFFHEAAADQQLKGFLRGDETYRLTNLHPALPIVSGRLPGIRARAFVRFVAGAVHEVPLSLDTLTVLADDGRLQLSWRGVIEVAEDDFEDVAALVIGAEPLGEPRSDAFYRAELDRAKEGSVPQIPPELQAQRDEALAQLEAMQKATAAARTGEKPPAVAIADLLGATLPPGDPRAADVRQKVLDAFAAHDAHVPPERSQLAKLVPPEDLPPSPPPVRDLAKGEAPKLAPSRKLAKGIEDAIAEGTAAEPHLAHDPKGQAIPQAREVLSRLEALKVDPRFGPVFKERVEPGPGRDLSDQDLEGEDLRGANLEGANMEGAILTRANLAGANLRGARLVSAVLFRAQLDGADLEGATLTLANFTESAGKSTSFRRVALDRTFFEKARLPGADFTGVRGLGGFFDRTELEDSIFDEADLERTLFGQAWLDRASFRRARLRRVSFNGCRLPNASFEGALLSSSSLLDCDASDARFPRVEGQGVSLQGSRLDRADFTGARLPGLLMPRASLVGAILLGADLRGAKAGRATLDRAVFDRANLAEADLRKVSCHGTSFRGASLFAAVLLGAAGKGTELAGANLKRCQIEGLA
jgi:uncharacterized protein YjbI with pentapeptide repeats